MNRIVGLAYRLGILEFLLKETITCFEGISKQRLDWGLIFNATDQMNALLSSIENLLPFIRTMQSSSIIQELLASLQGLAAGVMRLITKDAL